MAFIGNNPKQNTSTLTPQSATPTNPAEGMIFRSDGTVLAKGIWEYRDSTWVKLDSTAAPIVAVYETDAGQTISDDTDTIINFEDQIIDTNSAVTTGAAWKFTAPEDGTYEVYAVIFCGGSLANRLSQGLYIKVNSTKEAGTFDGNGTNYAVLRSISTSGTFELSASDTISIVHNVNTSDSSSRSLGTTGYGNSVSIKKIR